MRLFAYRMLGASQAFDASCVFGIRTNSRIPGIVLGQAVCTQPKRFWKNNALKRSQWTERQFTSWLTDWPFPSLGTFSYWPTSPHSVIAHEVHWPVEIWNPRWQMVRDSTIDRAFQGCRRTCKCWTKDPTTDEEGRNQGLGMSSRRRKEKRFIFHFKVVSSWVIQTFWWTKCQYYLFHSLKWWHKLSNFTFCPLGIQTIKITENFWTFPTCSSSVSWWLGHCKMVRWLCLEERNFLPPSRFFQLV